MGRGEEGRGQGRMSTDALEMPLGGWYNDLGREQ